MSALVKLNLSSRKSNYLKLDVPPWVEITNTRSALGIQIGKGVKVVAQSGDNAGDTLDNEIIPANKRVSLEVGTISPQKFQAIIECNPALHKYGVVGHARIVEPGDTVDLAIYLKTDKQLDLSTIDWFLRVYMID
jgi:hypothetical protein